MGEHECKYEERISKLEGDTRVNNVSINELTNKISDLATELKWQNRFSLGILITALAFLLKPYFGG